jgi:hypothetical protein
MPNPNPIVTLVTYNDILIVKNDKFEPNSIESMDFRLYNNSNSKLDLKRFEIRISGSFLSNFDLNNTNVKVMLKVKGTNQIF